MFQFISFLFFVTISNVLAEDDGVECMKVLSYVNRIHSCCDDPEIQHLSDKAQVLITNFEELTCEKGEELSKKYGYWKGGEIDKDVYRKLLEVSIEKHPKISELLKPMKDICAGDGGYEDSFPNAECSVRKFYACIFGMTLNYCKTWKTTEQCKDLSSIKESCNKILN